MIRKENKLKIRAAKKHAQDARVALDAALAELRVLHDPMNCVAEGALVASKLSVEYAINMITE